jgi:UDP-N-acetylmuramate--alanine ligase
MFKPIHFFFENPNTSWHLIGIGGCGMLPLTYLLKTMFKNISGSDTRLSKSISKLTLEGIKIYNTQRAENVNKSDIIVYSSAIKDNNPEIIAAKKKKISIFHRSEILNYIINLHETSIAIMGTHGKGTITGAISESNEKINYYIGATLKSNNTCAKLNKPFEYFVAEIDESDGSFYNIQTTHLLINNIQNDHLDYWKSLDNLIEILAKYIIRNIKLTTIYLNIDDLGCQLLHTKIVNYKNIRIITYGQSSSSDFTTKITSLKNYVIKNSYSKFYINHKKFFTPLIGEYNILNLSGALSVIQDLKLNKKPETHIKRYLGLNDRIDITEDSYTNLFIKIYAHHPEEIKLNLETLKNSKYNTVVIFEPFNLENITYLSEYQFCFKTADQIFIIDNYKDRYVKDMYNLISHPNKFIIKNTTQLFNNLVNYYKFPSQFIFLGVPNKCSEKNILEKVDNFYNYFNVYKNNG